MNHKNIVFNPTY